MTYGTEASSQHSNLTVILSLECKKSYGVRYLRCPEIAQACPANWRALRPRRVVHEEPGAKSTRRARTETPTERENEGEADRPVISKK
jgi:hypothetical protein